MTRAEVKLMTKPDLKLGRLEHSPLHLLHRAGQRAEVLFMTEAGTGGLTPRQYAVLLTVDGNEDISQKGLVAETGIDRSTLADVVHRLVGKGMLQRKRTRHDARMYAVRLTPKGREMLAATRPSALRADERVLSGLSSRQRSDFIAILAEVVASLEASTNASE